MFICDFACEHGGFLARLKHVRIQGYAFNKSSMSFFSFFFFFTFPTVKTNLKQKDFKYIFIKGVAQRSHHVLILKI